MQNKGAGTKISQAYLKSILDYDPDTGVFIWKYRPREYFKTEPAWKTWNARYSSKVAGCEHIGYTRIMVDGRQFLAHRLAWLYVHGEFPQDQIDHISGAYDDNRIVNLRPVACAENLRNQKRRKNNSSSITGVYWNKRMNKWQAYIYSGYKQTHLGLFSNIFDAACARKSAENRLGFHANHGRK